MKWIRGWAAWLYDSPSSYLMATAAAAVLTGRIGAVVVMAFLT